jgi:hypothetical protein
MKTVTECQGRQCDVERGLPFVGPLVAFGAMVVVIAATPVMMLIG